MDRVLRSQWDKTSVLKVNRSPSQLLPQWFYCKLCYVSYLAPWVMFLNKISPFHDGNGRTCKMLLANDGKIIIIIIKQLIDWTKGEKTWLREKEGEFNMVWRYYVQKETTPSKAIIKICLEITPHTGSSDNRSNKVCKIWAGSKSVLLEYQMLKLKWQKRNWK